MLLNAGERHHDSYFSGLSKNKMIPKSKCDCPIHRVQRLPSGWFDNKMRCAFRALPVRLIFIQMDCFVLPLRRAVRQL